MAKSSPTIPDCGLGTLKHLPAELREMIYTPLFCAGHTTLARASKAIYEDTKSALFKHGVYRMDIEYLGNTQTYCWKVTGQPSPTILPYIKNLLVRVCMKYGIGDDSRSMMHHPFAFESERIMSIYTWNSHPDDKKCVLHPSGIAGTMDSANLKLQSHSLRSLLRQMVDEMENPGRCVFECELPRWIDVTIPSSIFDSMESLRKFSCVVVAFSSGPFFCRSRAVMSLEKGIQRVATSSLNTKQVLGPRGDLDKGPELKIIQRVSYRVDFERPDVKFWGDDPEDQDYGLGEWTEALGRVWPPKSA